MELIKSKKANINYLAKIVEVKEFYDIIGADRLKHAYVDGYKIVISKESQPGLYVYFPTNCTINPEYLSYHNLYRHSNLNKDNTQSGMFDDNGRVKTIKLIKGTVLSEGFLMPLVALQNFIVDNLQVELNDVKPNIEFDQVEHDGKSFWINKKYVPKVQQGSGNHNAPRGKQPKGFDKLVDGQFRFHYDTVIIKKVPTAINPDDLIHISEKIHGTSGISAYVLCKKKLNLFGKIKKLFKKDYEELDYDYIYSSRTVIKNRYYNKNVGSGYYGVDVWGEANKYLRPYLEKGMTFYYEIVGYLPTGSYIQKDYDYGCVTPKTNEQYTPEKHFKVRIYRITLTNVDGKVHEFSAREVQQYCKMHGLTPVKELYYGYAKDLYPELDRSEHWHMNFIEALANDKERFYMEENSPSCTNTVPHEGIVIKSENMRSEAFKLKCFNFLNKEQKELDKGETNVEDEA